MTVYDVRVAQYKCTNRTELNELFVTDWDSAEHFGVDKKVHSFGVALDLYVFHGVRRTVSATRTVVKFR